MRNLIWQKAHGYAYVTDEKMNLSLFKALSVRMAYQKLFGCFCALGRWSRIAQSLQKQPSASYIFWHGHKIYKLGI